jgi:hypothetical protein
MYAALIATWTQAIITAMTIPTPMVGRLETARRRDILQGATAVPVEAFTRPDPAVCQEHGHQREAVVLAFPRGGLATTLPNAES